MSKRPHLKNDFLSFALLTLVMGLGCAQNKSVVPGPLSPQHLILNLSAHPSDSVRINWQSNPDPKALPLVGQVQWMIAPAGPIDASQASTLPVSPHPQQDHSRVSFSVELKNLQPNSLYIYRVSVSDQWTEWNQFRTAQNTPQPFRFLYFGDVQNDILDQDARVLRAAYAKAPDAAFALFAGDLVNYGPRDDNWQELSQALGWIPRTLPMVPVAGNHEYLSPLGHKGDTLTRRWHAFFNLPHNGPKGLEDSVYFVQYQGLTLYVLDGNRALEEQAQWLETQLKVQPKGWTLVSVHQPLYSPAKRRNNELLRGLLAPIFDRYGVDLVLQGHDHAYSRTAKLFAGKKVADDQAGTVYMTSVVGTKVYPIDSEFADLFVAHSNGLQLFQVISVSPESLRLEAWTAAGTLHDALTLSKIAPTSVP